MALIMQRADAVDGYNGSLLAGMLRWHSLATAAAQPEVSEGVHLVTLPLRRASRPTQARQVHPIQAIPNHRQWRSHFCILPRAGRRLAAEHMTNILTCSWLALAPTC